MLKAGLRPLQNERLLFTCSVPLGCREPGTEAPGEATKGILLRATESWAPAGGREALTVLYPDRELTARGPQDPLQWSRGKWTGGQLPSPHLEPCVLSNPLLPQASPCAWGEKSPRGSQCFKGLALEKKE